MAAFFNRVQRKKSPRGDELLIYLAHSGEVTQPRTGKQMKPWLPRQGRDRCCRGEATAAQPFVDWLTSKDNPLFAKVEANRIWSFVMGRGIVDPPDDFRDSNPPSNAALLDALAKDFAEHGFDRKHLLRTILNSRTYQADFRANEFNKDEVKYFSHYQPRLLSAEQLLDAICAMTGLPETFTGLPAGMKATRAARAGPRQARVPEDLWPAGAADGLCLRADERLEPGDGDPVFQRAADLWQAARRQQPLPQAAWPRQIARRDHPRAVPGRRLPRADAEGAGSQPGPHCRQEGRRRRAGRHRLGHFEYERVFVSALRYRR